MSIKRRMLLVLPFDSEEGASGRKKGAIDSLIKAYDNIGIIVECVALTPNKKFLNDYKSEISTANKLILNCLISISNKFTIKITSVIWFNFIYSIIANRHNKVSYEFSLAYALTNKPILFSYYIKRKCGLPYFISEHRSVYQRQYKAAGKIPKKDHLAISNSKGVMCLTESHLKALAMFGIQNLSIVPLSLEDTFFDNTLKIKKDDSLINISAWTNWRDLKRLDLTIDACEKLESMGFNIKLNIAGPLSYQKHREKLNQSKLKNLNYLGALGRDGIKKLAYQTDIYLLTSDHETFAIPVSEALSAGAHVVTTKCGGPEQLIAEGVNGYAVDVGDLGQIVDALIKCIGELSPSNKPFLVSLAFEQFSIHALEANLKSLHANFID
jgi:glycosyltransferase involved in cell wall biosynthesis